MQDTDTGYLELAVLCSPENVALCMGFCINRGLGMVLWKYDVKHKQCLIVQQNIVCTWTGSTGRKLHFCSLIMLIDIVPQKLLYRPSLAERYTHMKHA